MGCGRRAYDEKYTESFTVSNAESCHAGDIMSGNILKTKQSINIVNCTI